MSRDPFKIDGPTCISFSGGRTSGYMLWRFLESNGGQLPAGAFTAFANTGKEAEETLRFVRDVQDRWGVPIVWLERPAGGGFKQVNFHTANRTGEPFETLIRERKFLPNPVARFCTVELKILPAEALMRACGYDEFDSMLGFRADEPLRVAKIRAQPVIPSSPGVERCVPLATAGVSKSEVRDFWSRQPFDLALPMDFDGTTIDGNCDGCFLKSPAHRVSAMQHKPGMSTWWIRMEDMTGGKFTKDGYSYREMARFARDQSKLFDEQTESIDCFCGD